MTVRAEGVGAPLERPDAWGKVTGTTPFLDDLDHAGAWLGAVVRSPVPRGLLHGVKVDPAFADTGAVLVTAADLPGPNVVAMVREDLPALADGTVQFATQPVALVAAPDAATLRAAVALVTPDIEELPPVLDLDAALAGAGPVLGEDNLVQEYLIESGDLEAAFAAADHVVEGEYHTGYQEQMYLEPQGVVAAPREDGGVEILGSLQCPYYVHNALRRALDLDAERVVVRQSTTGGAFGGKEDYPSVLALQAALLALRCGHAVKMVMDRHEDVAVTPKRHPSRSRYRTAFDAAGNLLALDADVVLDAGAYTTLSPVVLSRAVLHAAGAYRVPVARIRGRAVATNTPPNGAFRGFGVPQSIFAVEQQMDRAARALGMDPVVLRRRNLLRDGDRFPFGQVLRPGMAAAEPCLEALVERFGLEARRAEAGRVNAEGGRLRRGVGTALVMHGGGFTGDGELRIQGKADVRLDDDGGVTILVSSVEMGQGARTVLPMLAAEALDLPLDRVRYHQPDTSAVPDSGPTVASRTTMVVGRILVSACEDLLRQAREAVGEGDDVLARAAGRELVGRGAYEHDERIVWDQEAHRGDAYQAWSWAAVGVEVDVDLDTFEVRPRHCTHVVEIGKAVNPVLCVGQVEGGTLQGLAWGSIEEIKTAGGRYLNDRMATCIIPTSLDAPDFEVELLEQPSDRGPYGAKGLGELPMNGGAPALAAAVADALGFDVDAAPATPEYLLARSEEARR